MINTSWMFNNNAMMSTYMPQFPNSGNDTTANIIWGVLSGLSNFLPQIISAGGSRYSANVTPENTSIFTSRAGSPTSTDVISGRDINVIISDIAQTASTLGITCNPLTVTVQEVNIDIENDQESADALRNAATTAKGVADDAANNAATANSNLINAQNTQNVVKNQIDSLTNTSNALEIEISGLNNTLDSAERRKTFLEKKKEKTPEETLELQTLTTQVNTLNSEIKAKNQQKKEIDEELKAKKEYLSTLTTNIVELDNIAKGAKTKQGELEKAAEEADKKADEAETRLQEKISEMQKLKDLIRERDKQRAADTECLEKAGLTSDIKEETAKTLLNRAPEQLTNRDARKLVTEYISGDNNNDADIKAYFEKNKGRFEKVNGSVLEAINRITGDNNNIYGKLKEDKNANA